MNSEYIDDLLQFPAPYTFDGLFRQFYTSERSPAFIFTTENYKHFEDMDVIGKDILTAAAGSGDNVLIWRRNGAKSVDQCDISLIPHCVTEAKFKSLQMLDRKQFKKAWNIGKGLYKGGFDKDLLAPVLEQTSPGTQRLFAHDKTDEIIWRTDKYRVEELPYLKNDKIYNEFKQYAADTPIFTWDDICDLAFTLDKKYDIIHLSNIFSDEVLCPQSIPFIRNLLTKLNPGGELIFYFYAPNFEEKEDIDLFFGAFREYANCEYTMTRYTPHKTQRMSGGMSITSPGKKTVYLVPRKRQYDIVIKLRNR